MPEKDAFSDLRKAKEEEFFHSREQALLENLKRRAAAASETRKLGEALGTKDEQILEDLRALGYTAEMTRILFAVPLIAVAWADGEVSERERSLIQELAEIGERDVVAAHQLDQWLASKPPQDFLDRSLRIIGSLLKALPPGGESGGRELVASVTRIAEASGGFLGLGSISASERALIERVAGEIEDAHSEAARDVGKRL